MRPWGAAPFLLLLLFAGCSPAPSEYQQTLYVFGTLVDFKLRGVERERAVEAVTAVDEAFQRMHRDWHAWKPPGELSRLNRDLPAGEALPVSPFLMPLITRSRTLFRESDGLFNPAIGRLIALWGFHNDELPAGPPPAKESIEALVKQAPGMDDLEMTEGRVRSRNPAVSLDFGGFAKGYALNEAIHRMRGFGVENAIVNAGGDLCVSGRHGDRPWRIGVRHPQGEGVLASLDVADGECVLTSGNYERYREHEGIRWSHVIDPRDGMPVRHIASATVIDRDGGKADAAATALTVAGPQGWHPIARRMGLKFVMLVDETGVVYMNPAMAERVEFETDPAGGVVISDPL